MTKAQIRPTIQPSTTPRVLLLGNGMLRLMEGMDWSQLLEGLSNKAISKAALTRLPFSMQPEALCGEDAEEVQRKATSRISTNAIGHLSGRLKYPLSLCQKQLKSIIAYTI